MRFGCLVVRPRRRVLAAEVRTGFRLDELELELELELEFEPDALLSDWVTTFSEGVGLSLLSSADNRWLEVNQFRFQGKDKRILWWKQSRGLGLEEV